VVAEAREVMADQEETEEEETEVEQEAAPATTIVLVIQQDQEQAALSGEPAPTDTATVPTATTIQPIDRALIDTLTKSEGISNSCWDRFLMLQETRRRYMVFGFINSVQR